MASNPGLDDRVEDDLRGLEPLLHLRGRALALAAVAAGDRRAGGRVVVEARGLRAVGVEPRRDAHPHVQQLHVLAHPQPLFKSLLALVSSPPFFLEKNLRGSRARRSGGEAMSMADWSQVRLELVVLFVEGGVPGAGRGNQQQAGVGPACEVSYGVEAATRECYIRVPPDTGAQNYCQPV
jgi:hypothetical protein